MVSFPNPYFKVNIFLRKRFFCENLPEILEECLRLGELYGHVARGFLGYKVIVFLTDPQDVEIILNSNVHLKKSTDYRFFKPWYPSLLNGIKFE